jgi:molecular chaperone GrpE
MAMAKKKRSIHVPVTKSDSEGQKAKKDVAEKSAQKKGTSDKEAALDYDELVDTLQRLKAEYLNYQKRVEREREESRQTCMREAFLKVLPVLDNLERAIEAAGAGGEEDMLKGVELVLKHFRQVLSSEDIEPFESVGEKFDPRYHEAVMVQESAEAKPDTVLAQMERGYMIGEKVLRPAKVIVSRAPREPEGSEE